jgi:hypothetical protein
MLDRDDYFTLRIQLDSMGAQIVKMFPAEMFKEQIENAVKRGIASFEFEKEVERATHALLQDRVRMEVSKRISHIATEATGAIVKEKLKEALRKELGELSGGRDAWGFPL